MQIIFSTDAAQKAYASTDSVFSALQDVFAPKAGDTVTATVIFASASSVNIKLQNGAVIRAVIEGSTELNEGDEVRFLVSESSKSRISLIPVEIARPGRLRVPWPVNSETAAAQTGGNQAVFNAIYRNGYPYSPELAEKSAKILSSFPGTEAETAVFIAANDIPATHVNLDIAGALNKSDLKVGSLIGQLLDMLPGILSLNSSKKEPASQLQETSTLDDFYSIGNLPRKDAPAAQSRPIGGAFPLGEDDGKSGSVAGVFISDNNAPSAKPEEPTNIFNTKDTNSAASFGRTETGKAALAGVLLAVESGDAPSLSSFMQALSSVTIGATSSATQGPGGHMPFDPTAIQSLEESLFASAENATGAKLQDAAAFLPQKLALLSAFAMAAGADKEKITAGTSRLTNLTELLKTVMLISCIQIPLRMGSQRSTAEMYVLRRKKKFSGPASGEISALLSLDTRNMGHIEALLRVRESGVSAEMTAESEQIAEHIREHSCEFYALLSSAGYRLTHIRVTAAESKTTPINAPAVFVDDENTRNQKINISI